ncbi:MAG TPA: hypothetical protein VJT75_11415 [Thermoleophilaceae bacterium]|nr:hypothetical protein [Thermoleophilaceae bacterium]
MDVAAPPERVWGALTAYMGGSSRRSEAGAALLGCRERSATGSLDRAGSAIPGFRVDRASPGAELALAGRHRFSSYALTFVLEPLGPGRTRLRAVTHAAFPGVAGTAYRALVIGTRLHVAATTAMLRGVRRAAESSKRAD